jgi:hypothetical protein
MRDETSRSDRLARVVHWTLLGGVIASAALLVAGLVLARGTPVAPGEPVSRLGRLAARALAGDGVAVLDVGLLVLMLTPVCRVAVLAVGWLLARQWAMALVALTVAAMLGLSVGLGVG